MSTAGLELGTFAKTEMLDPAVADAAFSLQEGGVSDPVQGRFGPGGQRRANFALQNSDLVLAIGTSLSISCVGFSDRFAPKATRVLVNIDEGDLEKKNIKIDSDYVNKQLAEIVKDQDLSKYIL